MALIWKLNALSPLAFLKRVTRDEAEDESVVVWIMAESEPDNDLEVRAADVASYDSLAHEVSAMRAMSMHLTAARLATSSGQRNKTKTS